MTRMLAAFLLLFAIAAPGQFGGRQPGGFGQAQNGLESGGRGCLVLGYRLGGTGEQDTVTPRDIDRTGFVYARIKYTPDPIWRFRTPNEVPWHHDYHDGDEEFPLMLSRLTTAQSSVESYQLVDIDSKELFQYPFTYISEPGYLDLGPEDVENLREYLDRGGFLLIDDFRGNPNVDAEQDMQNLRVQMHKVYPDRPILPVPASHPIFHTFYDLDPADMKPPYLMENSGPPQFLAISDKHDRIQVMIDYNNDMSEYWQALDVGTCSIHESGRAVQLGVNYAIYAMTH